MLVKQKVGEALEVAEGYLLKNGQVALEGTPKEIREAISKRVVHA